MLVFKGSGGQDSEFKRWRNANPSGYVLNVRSGTEATLHRATCSAINRDARRESYASHEKRCGASRDKLSHYKGKPVSRCGLCKP